MVTQNRENRKKIKKAPATAGLFPWNRGAEKEKKTHQFFHTGTRPDVGLGTIGTVLLQPRVLRKSRD